MGRSNGLAFQWPGAAVESTGTLLELYAELRFRLLGLNVSSNVPGQDPTLSGFLFFSEAISSCQLMILLGSFTDC